jgi:hypothetical protein
MKKILNRVVNLLTKHPQLRDDDARLTANIWYQNTDNIKNMDAVELLTHLADGNLPSYESISRCRRKIQEEKPELRGKKWDKRHSKKLQKQIKDDIKQIGAILND